MKINGVRTKYKVFRSDPLKKISDERSRADRFNKKYLIELKCRKYSIDKIKLWGGAMIERDKYRCTNEWMWR